MTFIQLLLELSGQTIRCEAIVPQRSITFLGNLDGRNGLRVKRGGRDFDAAQSRWTIAVFDSQEQPLTEFYVELAKERKFEWLAGAIYLSPHEYDEQVQPEMTVYVWLPSRAFNSLWNSSPAIGAGLFRASLTLTVPFRGSALNYASAGSDKVWNAEAENPLLFQSTEFHISPVSQVSINAASVRSTEA